MPWFPPVENWLAVTAPLTCGSYHRSADVLEQVIDQFQVATAGRYRRTPTDTWCSLFVWDVTRALGCEVPKWKQLGASIEQLTANQQADWLASPGAIAAGWVACTVETGRQRAGAGFPVVYVAKNPAGHGHIAVGRPAPSMDVGAYIAQAGGSNFNAGSLALGFGSLTPKAFTHP